MSSDPGASYYAAFVALCIITLKAVNEEVTEPYMDEPFHVPQAQAYCRGDYWAWDPKITTPPGLYVLSLLLKQVFMFKCNLAMLRLTPALSLAALPFALTRLLCYHRRVRPPYTVFVPTTEGVVLTSFPIAWFFGFLYYTETPSLFFVVTTVVAASQGRHWLAALLGAVSCTFRQNNIVWSIMYLRFRRTPAGARPVAKLHDPPALDAIPADLVHSVITFPRVLLDILGAFVPYALVLAGFGAFVVWNGGIVLGDKSNHVPALHIPQLYYFVGFATIMGWPALISGKGGLYALAREVWKRMFGTVSIHHPFLLADNRHYTFYVWRRVFMLHPVIPYLLIPGYIACTWAWFIRIGQDQTLLQNLLLPVFVLPTLIPTPLLEPRYFLIPYILLRAQVVDVPLWAILGEGFWYGLINAATMYVYLHKERAGVGRFMW
ncbi:glucosyltransferase [Fomitopsis serialis]|uniref:glucosyltransferase n=1 Tax=Fomitopsis serialis TaxID=139415 RepID=UPI0020088BA2|nr:glucosyltransferase [Neoantrodia serialis]KAH9919109.1 glucosyltransferase [Neoantrodia serialis]